MTLPLVRVLFTMEQIQNKVRELATAIDARYARSEDLVLVGVLRGAVYFLTDLSRALKTPHRIDFVEYASYRGTRREAGRLVKGCSDPIQNADVLLVDEILDTGETLAALRAYLAAANPSSLGICALFVKAIRGDLGADDERTLATFRGFTAGPEFLVGYGLDYNQLLRHLPYVGVIDDDPPEAT